MSHFYTITHSLLPLIDTIVWGFMEFPHHTLHTEVVLKAALRNQSHSKRVRASVLNPNFFTGVRLYLIFDILKFL